MIPGAELRARIDHLAQMKQDYMRLDGHYRREFTKIWRSIQRLPAFERKTTMSKRGKFKYAAPYEPVIF